MRKSCVTVALYAMLASQAYAMSDSEFAARVSEAHGKTAFSENISSAIQRYEDVRNRYVLSGEGIVAKSKQIFRDLDSWTAAWKNHLQSMNLVKLENYDAYIAESQLLYQEQFNDLQAIEARLENLRIMAVEAKSELNFTIPDWAAASERQRSDLARLSKNLRDLQNAIHSIEVKSRDKMGEIRFVQEIIPEGVATKIKQVLISKGPSHVDAAIKRYNEMIQAEVVTLPEILKATQAAHKMSWASLNSAYFTAKDLKKESDQNCIESPNRIEASGIGASYKAAAIARVNSLCRSMRTNYAALENSGMSPSEMVKDHTALMAISFKDVCSSSGLAGDCSEYRFLSSLDSVFFAGAKESDLRDIEYRWQKFQALKQ